MQQCTHNNKEHSSDDYAARSYYIRMRSHSKQSKYKTRDYYYTLGTLAHAHERHIKNYLLCYFECAFQSSRPQAVPWVHILIYTESTSQAYYSLCFVFPMLAILSFSISRLQQSFSSTASPFTIKF